MSDTERRERYEAAVKSVLPMTSGMARSVVADAVMAVADAELASANRQIDARRIELLRVNERRIADRAAVLHEAAELVAGLRDKTDVQVAEYQRYSPTQRQALDDAVRAIQRLTTTHDEQDPHA